MTGQLISRRPDGQLPGKQGLYDPQYEHDACGIGFVADIKGRISNQIVQQALTVLTNLSHRGARGSERNSGDGAGILLQIPDAFIRSECKKLSIALPEPGCYGVGMAFLSHLPQNRRHCLRILRDITQAEGQDFLGWRAVPTDNRSLGESARNSEPAIIQFFIGRQASISDDDDFERVLYLIRRRAEKVIGQLPGVDRFYVASLSHRTLVYKGMLTPEQLADYYPDLTDPAMETALALIHSRFSTNTFPSWERAHPYRSIIHNGEINTIQGNINWMRSRESQFVSRLFGKNLENLLPIIDEDGSDSSMFDNCLEFLSLAGRSLPHSLMMMIPEPWARHQTMSEEKRAFYEYHSCLMEPWDGPAAIAFTDGRQIGAVLDRNGLRPARYIVTKDDLVVLASEVGVLDIPAEQVNFKGRLQPGRMLLVDTIAGQIISDESLKLQTASAQPYRRWLDENMISLKALPQAPNSTTEPIATSIAKASLVQRQQAFGYTFEDLRIILRPMAEKGVEPIGSMGDDTPLAILSDKPQPLFNYFKQLFAQVTNPPIDSIREELIMDTGGLLGAEDNLLEPRPEDCRRIRITSPILTDDDLARLRHIQTPGFRVVTLPSLFAVEEGSPGLERSLSGLFEAADTAIASGANLLIVSDRGLDRQHAAIPSLLASAGLHHHLIRQGLRSKTSIIVESGEPREVHHFAALIGYGADAINPYLAFETLKDLADRQMLSSISYDETIKRYVKSIVKGVVKVISKMGISTIQSYRGAQIFEAVGLHRDVIDAYFTGTSSRIGGAGLDVLADEVRIRHEHAYPQRSANGHTLGEGGRYQWRQDGEPHLFNPTTIHRLQNAVRTGNFASYKKYALAVDDQTRQRFTLRGLMDFELAAEPIPLEEVESVESIVKRFKTGAMSYGSISQEAHETLAVAMNRLGGRSNTGEGGEDPERYANNENGGSRNSAIKQVASGRFGVTSSYLVSADEIQIKMAQGAKPGEGGQLPGSKVYPWIARVRHSTPGVGLISPPPHHDIYSIEDLAQLIYDLKNANPEARISVKLVSEVGVGTIAAGVAKGHADVILISGHDGGTGASPQTSIKHAGLPWELGLAETHQTLVLNDLRTRVTLETDGQLKTGRDVAVAALLGAEEFGFATAPLVAMGCLMMRVCHLDTCPVGVATQNPELRKKFAGKPEHVNNFMHFIAQDLREWMAQLGFRTVDEMIGRVDKLKSGIAVEGWKTRGLDISNILYQPDVSPQAGRYKQISQEHALAETLDRRVLLDLCRPALERTALVTAELPIRNIHRATGTILGSEITRRFGETGLPEDTIQLKFQGSAGQSFGAFIPKGLTLILEGDANDYTGKGLSGGKIIITPPAGSTFPPEENIIVGNVAFYGATGGEAYILGMAGERFCVRNSGLNAVVESVGDHGCEYMTGGRVFVLGRTGRNFAAGMSGGIAYVLDGTGDFASRCNQDMVELASLNDDEEIDIVKNMIWRHAYNTGSRRAWTILNNWKHFGSRFVAVVPRDYKRMVQAIDQAEKMGLSGEEAELSAFETNKRDAARVAGL